jgi:hypothetical protein
MRILFVSSPYPPYEVGGYEQLRRDKVSFLSWQPPDKMSEFCAVVNTFAKAGGTK